MRNMMLKGVVRIISIVALVSMGSAGLVGCATLDQNNKNSEGVIMMGVVEAEYASTATPNALNKTPYQLYASEIARAEILGQLLFEATSREDSVVSDAESSRAIEMVTNANYKTCTRPYRTVTTYLGSENEGTRTTYVYKLSSPADPSILSLGVHHRFEVSPTQFLPSELISYTGNCLEVAPEPNTYAISITHSRVSYPEDIHVWLSLEKNLEVHVTTKKNDAYWVIRAGKISWLTAPTKEQRALLGLPDIPEESDAL